MKFIILSILLLISTSVFAATYVKIDDQNFKQTVEVTVNYEELKRQWQVEQNQIENYLVDVNKHRANQIVLETEIAQLEALGARFEEIIL